MKTGNLWLHQDDVIYPITRLSILQYIQTSAIYTVKQPEWSHVIAYKYSS